MKKPEVYVFLRPKLKEPVFVGGLTGYGDVGRLAARMLIEDVRARKFAEIYSPNLPEYVIVNDDGICNLPRYEFYYSSETKPNLVILTGDAQPDATEVKAHYELCSLVLELARELGCKRFITLGGFPVLRWKKEVYVAATSKELAAYIAKRGGGALYRDGRIIGAAGLILGLAKAQNLRGECILGVTSGYTPDKEAAHLVFQYLKKVLKMD